VRDFTVTAALDYRTRSRIVSGTTVRVYYRPGAPGARMLDAAADAFAALRARLGPYPYPTFKVVQSAGGYGMESPRLIWIPTGTAAANLRYLAAHETAHQWFYGIVGNDQATEPFVDEAAADFVARSILGMKRASRCATARLDRRIYDYSAKCYYEDIYIQGGNLLDAARRRMGSTAFWAALRGYVATNRNRIVATGTLLDALDAATPLDLGGTLFSPRFPRLY
jgi:aminopeptidase N